MSGAVFDLSHRCASSPSLVGFIIRLHVMPTNERFVLGFLEFARSDDVEDGPRHSKSDR